MADKVDHALGDSPAADPPLAVSPAAGPVRASESTRNLEDEEPETVLVSDFVASAWLDVDPSAEATEEEPEDGDPETVRQSKFPIAFIGESVMDDDTVTDERLPTGWRQMLDDDATRPGDVSQQRPRADPAAIPVGAATVPRAQRRSSERVTQPGRQPAPVHAAPAAEAGPIPIWVWVGAGFFLATGAIMATLLLLL